MAHASGNATKSQAGHHGVGHVVPFWLLLLVLIILLALTWVTVAASNEKFQLSQGVSVGLAMLIASVKGTLVALYFMHLRWDRAFNGVIFLGSLFLVSLFIWFASLDTLEYRPMVQSYREGGTPTENRWADELQRKQDEMKLPTPPPSAPDHP